VYFFVTVGSLPTKFQRRVTERAEEDREESERKIRRHLCFELMTRFIPSFSLVTLKLINSPISNPAACTVDLVWA
jgi:hypothetical protein